MPKIISCSLILQVQSPISFISSYSIKTKPNRAGHNLCMLDANKGLAVENMAVRVLLRMIKECIHVEDMLGILAMLSIEDDAVMEMSWHRAFSHVFFVIRETHCECIKKYCMVVMHRIFFTNKTKRYELRVEENDHETVSTIKRTGSRRAKGYAKEFSNISAPVELEPRLLEINFVGSNEK
ncbi:hypothetical protein OSB04_006256 [Centaurea solstitialis]|uniref:Uncharacterized protein n=1 Tax=Centaurea solstitialis TaxID=347529 RepID=A0AA38WSK1_9ASTR|nr:hypothetical protein OSB04_006256 [Centaurea solstitialis]